MIYLVALFAFSLILSGLLLAIAHWLKLRRGHAFLMVCVLITVIFLAVGFYFFAPDAAPTVVEAVEITEGRLLDPGPGSFLTGMAFGIVPAFIYFTVSILMFFAVRSSKSG